MHKDFLQSIQKISRTITRNIGLEETLETIVDEIIEHLSSVGGTVFLVDEKKKLVRAYKNATSKLGLFITRKVDDRLRSLTTPYDLPLNDVGRCVAEERIIVGERVEDFVCPTVSKAFARGIQKMGGIRSLAALPAIVDGRVVGALLIAFKEKPEELEDKILLMELFSDQVAIAINNALKYEELRRLYELEKETTALLSHELKTPLVIAHNQTERLKMFLDAHGEDLGEKSEKLEQLHGGMRSSVERMAALCTSIFNMREIESREMKELHPLDLEYLLEHVVGNVARKAEEKGLDFFYEFLLHAENKFGPAFQFEQVLVILMDNALKYTETGELRMQITLNDDRLEAVVTDSGVGIDVQDHERIFERYVRTGSGSKSVPGLGLGLYLAKRLMEQVGGEISVAPAESGQGTQFLVRVPVYDSRDGV